MSYEKTITKSGREFDAKSLQEDLEWVNPLTWTAETWQAKDALKSLKGNDQREYIGQAFDPNQFEIIKQGWNHDHCEICFSAIYENEKCATSDDSIICENCYSDFIEK